MIFNLTYVSAMAESVSPDELDELLKRSRNRNAELGITGLLLYRQGRVMQTIEGEERVVKNLFGKIRDDVRHRHVLEMWASSLTERRFPEWSMGFEALPTNHVASTRVTGGSDGWQQTETFSAPLVSIIDEETGDRGGDHSLRSLQWDQLPADQAEFLARRAAVLRQALVSGQRLTSALAMILHAHEPAAKLVADGHPALSCNQCRTYDDQELDGYPCFTADNAFWALNATLR